MVYVKSKILKTGVYLFAAMEWVWLGFDSWPGNFQMPQVQLKKEKYIK